MKRFDAVAAGCLPTWLRSRIFVEVLIKETKAAGAVNTKFCEFDGEDGEGGVYLNLKECLPVCDYLHHCNLYLCNCICVFIFVYLYLCICICVFVFVYLYLCICICVFVMRFERILH